MRLTKISVAEAHICSAVRLYFSGGHIASVHLLAGSAREILTTVGGKLGIRTIVHRFSEDQNVPFKDVISAAHASVNFLKHADRDMDGTVDLSAEQTRDLLMMVCNDFGQVAGGMPVEAQIYESWWFVTQINDVQKRPSSEKKTILNQIKFWPPGLRTAAQTEQRRIGWEMLRKFEDDPSLIMDFSREVSVLGRVGEVNSQIA